MMNYKCKSHRGRSPDNKTDALCMVEVDQDGHITRVFAKVISDKRAETIIPLIIRNAVYGSTIYTDEHPSYRSLSSYGFKHFTVCHKYEFVNSSTGTHTQNVESFNNCLKCGIKCQMGVKTSLRQVYLNWFCYYYNNRETILKQ